MPKAKKPPTKATPQRNEGEGNRTAARRYDKAQQEFVKRGKVEEKARESERAVERDERKELERAEQEGRRHIAEEDPEVER
ncbi:MAG TPA: hypothetical protein VLV50_10725 [Stellaceae bacterium]|nr:hypothetical protein [Stellaceae bacterium]